MPPSQLAWREPLANPQRPVMRQPPGTAIACPFGPGPQASTARGLSPNIWRAAGCGRYAEVSEHPDPWPTHHATLASISASASTTSR